MSRSRRRQKRGKCTGCGRHYVVYRGLRRRGKLVADCPILHYPHEWNSEREAYRRAKEGLSDERDDD